MTSVANVWAPLEIAINRFLSLDPDSDARLTPLQGKVFALDFKGFDISLYLLVSNGRIHVLSAYTGQPTTRLVGTPLALARLGYSGDSVGAMSGDIEVHGSVESARRLQSALAGFTVDWEEQLASVVGDVAARPMANLARGILGWGLAAAQTLRMDVAEYLHEEARWLPLRSEVEAFSENVDSLRDDVARLAARVDRLRRSLI